MDLNLIETAFSAIKSFLKKNREFIESCNDPIYTLLIASFHITAAMVEGFFKGTVYLKIKNNNKNNSIDYKIKYSYIL